MAVDRFGHDSQPHRVGSFLLRGGSVAFQLPEWLVPGDVEPAALGRRINFPIDYHRRQGRPDASLNVWALLRVQAKLIRIHSLHRPFTRILRSCERQKPLRVVR